MRRIKLTAFLWVISFINFCSPVLLSWVFLDCDVAVNLMLHGHLPERHQQGSPEKSWKSICSAASICPQNLVPGCIWCNLVILDGSCSWVWCQTLNIGLRNPRPLRNCPISLSVYKHLHTDTHCESVVYLDNLGRQLNALGFFRLKPEHQTQSTDGGASRASQLLWKAELLVESERIDDFCGFLCFKVFKVFKGNIGNGWKWFG